MIRINAKSAPEEIQLMARVKSGFKNIEIQLINKEVAKEEYDITKKMIEEDKIDISVVHTPLVQTETGKIEISLNQILKDSYYKMLCDTVEYAEFISNIEKQSQTPRLRKKLKNYIQDIILMIMYQKQV